MSPEQVIFSIVSALFGLVGLGLSIAAFRHSRKKEHSDELKQRFGQVDDALRRLSVLELQMTVFWKSVSFSSAQALHSPHTPKLDRLIELFQQEKINSVQLLEFKAMLTDIVNDPDETAFRKKAAHEVLTLIHLRYEISGVDGGVKSAYHSH